MSPESIEIVYAAHTSTCTFLLDAEGICRRVVLAPTVDGKRRDNPRTASRCVGAQYVASLDLRALGGLVERPRIGAAMLFARTDSRGRVSLVRTGLVTRFETKRAEEDPFDSMGSIRTSAPALQQLFTPKSTPAIADVAGAVTEREPEFDYEAEARTMPVGVVRPEELVETSDTDETIDIDFSLDGDVTFEQPRRATIPSPIAPTLWDQPSTDELDNPYARGPRTIPAPRTDPYLIRGVGRTPVAERSAPRVIGTSTPSVEPRSRGTREVASSRRRER